MEEEIIALKLEIQNLKEQLKNILIDLVKIKIITKQINKIYLKTTYKIS